MPKIDAISLTSVLGVVRGPVVGFVAILVDGFLLVEPGAPCGVCSGPAMIGLSLCGGSFFGGVLSRASRGGFLRHQRRV